MKEVLITIVIPARMASSRYPGKPLALISGIPLIEHVRRRALLADEATLVVVATCDIEIKNEVERSGGIAVMTKNTHDRCTDRIEEAIQNLPGDIIVMVQGDEPLINNIMLNQAIIPIIENSKINIINLIGKIDNELEFKDQNCIKVLKNINNEEIKIEIEKINKNLSKIEKIKKFFVIKNQFTIENNMMTPTLKLKRYKIIKTYQNELEKLFN